jgi:hypothetical protein
LLYTFGGITFRITFKDKDITLYRKLYLQEESKCAIVLRHWWKFSGGTAIIAVIRIGRNKQKR